MKIAGLSKRDIANVPRELVLRDVANGEILYGADEKPMVIWVYGAQSDRARNAQKAMARKSGRKSDPSDDELEKGGAEFLAALIQGWSDNWVDDDNEKIEYTAETALKVVMANDGIADQVWDFAKDIQNYDPKK
jgi:hypothetical protein